MLMAVPLLFAIQQFAEGLIWLSLKNHWPYTLPLTDIYLFFALLLWPIYIPLAARMLETNKVRQLIISIFCLGGAVVGIILYAAFLQKPEAAQIINQCLFYPNLAPYPTLFGYLYILFTVGVGAISSKTIIKLFSVLLLIFSLIAWYFYAINFTSVWCFFAAIISGVLYFYPKK